MSIEQTCVKYRALPCPRGSPLQPHSWAGGNFQKTKLAPSRIPWSTPFVVRANRLDLNHQLQMTFTTQNIAALFSRKPSPYAVAHQLGSLIGVEESQIPANITWILCSLIHPEAPASIVPTAAYPKEMAGMLDAYLAGVMGAPLPSNLPSENTEA